MSKRTDTTDIVLVRAILGLYFRAEAAERTKLYGAPAGICDCCGKECDGQQRQRYRLGQLAVCRSCWELARCAELSPQRLRQLASLIEDSPQQLTTWERDEQDGLPPSTSLELDDFYLGMGGQGPERRRVRKASIPELRRLWKILHG